MIKKIKKRSTKLLSKINSKGARKELIIVVFAGLGILLLASLSAAQITANLEAESSNLSGNAKVTQDSSASGGSFLQFGSGGSTDPSGGTTTINPTISTAYLGNPGIGWQDDNFTSPELPVSVEYYRSQFSWKDFNPSQGSYDWSKLNSRIADAKSRGNQVGFRIYSMRGEVFGGHQVPQWVLNQGAKLTSVGDPDYRNEIYQLRWAQFVEAMRQKYDGNPDIAFIDIAGYGDFNEWSWLDHQTEFENDYNNPTTLDGHARNHLADMFIGGSGTVKMRRPDGSTRTMNYSYPGFQKTQLIMPYAGVRQSTWYVWDKSKPIGFRFDCLGNSSLTDMMRLGDRFTEVWRNNPVVYELCSGIDTNKVKDVLDASRGSIVHDNGTTINSTLTNIFRYMGYRYALDEAKIDTQASAGSSVDFSLDWFNVGNAKAYPRMGQDFTVRVGLFNSSGQLVNETKLANVSSWLPKSVRGTSPYTVTGSVPIAGTSSGNSYKMRVAVYDKRTGKNINLAISLPKTNNWYELGTVNIK